MSETIKKDTNDLNRSNPKEAIEFSKRIDIVRSRQQARSRGAHVLKVHKDAEAMKPALIENHKGMFGRLKNAQKVVNIVEQLGMVPTLVPNEAVDISAAKIGEKGALDREIKLLTNRRVVDLGAKGLAIHTTRELPYPSGETVFETISTNPSYVVKVQDRIRSKALNSVDANRSQIARKRAGLERALKDIDEAVN